MLLECPSLSDEHQAQNFCFLVAEHRESAEGPFSIYKVDGRVAFFPEVAI